MDEYDSPGVPFARPSPPSFRPNRPVLTLSETAAETVGQWYQSRRLYPARVAIRPPAGPPAVAPLTPPARCHGAEVLTSRLTVQGYGTVVAVGADCPRCGPVALDMYAVPLCHVAEFACGVLWPRPGWADGLDLRTYQRVSSRRIELMLMGLAVQLYLAAPGVWGRAAMPVLSAFAGAAETAGGIVVGTTGVDFTRPGMF